MPFADYSDMDECKRAHGDKDDPGAYCARIHKEATGEWPAEKAGGGSLAARAAGLLASLLPGGGGAGAAVKVYVPEPSCVPPGPETQRDEGGWFYTETPEGLRERGAPSDFLEVVPADEVLYPSVRRAAGAGPGAAGKAWVPYSGPGGGEGWQSLEDPDDVRYTDEPPGETLSSEDLSEAFLGPIDTDGQVVAGENADSVVLADGAQKELRENIEEAFGDGGAEAYRLADMWKHSSWQDAAQTREKAMMEAFGIDGEARNGELDGEEPGGALVAATAVLGEVSREVLRGSDAANGDGTITLHRGLGDHAGRQLDGQYLEALAAGGGVFVFEENPAANYSMDKSVADGWGIHTATVTETVPIDDVLAATDAVADVASGEGEVTIEGGTREVAAEHVDLRSGDTAAALGGSDDFEDLKVPYRVAVDALVGGAPLTPEAVAGAEELAGRLRGSGGGDVAEEMADDIESHIDAARRHEPGRDVLSDLRGALPEDGRFATVSRAFMDADPELANDLNTVSFTEGNGAAFDLIEERLGSTAESGALARAVRDLNQREGYGIPVPLPGGPTADAKAAEPVRLADDPDSVDWVARSRTAPDPSTSKGPWIPYAGPDGGRGWQDASDPDDVRYTDDPPGEPLDPDAISDLEYERVAVGLDADVDGQDIKDMLREEYLGYTPDFDEGDTVVVEAGGDRVEGEVVFYDGDWVDVETGGGRTIEAEAGDVLSVVGRGEADTPWTGPKHRRSVEAEITADDIREGIRNTGLIDEPDKGGVLEAFDATIGPDGDWRGANDGVFDALAYAVGGDVAADAGMGSREAVRAIEREIRRGAAFPGNSAPDALDPSRAESVETLREASGADTGVTADAMDICEMPGGGRLFVTHTDHNKPRELFGEPEASGQDAAAAVSAAEALGAMGVEAPDHHYEHNRFLAVEEVEGRQVMSLAGDYDAARYADMEQVTEALAAQILVGNRDAHMGNVMLVRDREPRVPDDGEMDEAFSRAIEESGVEDPTDDRLSGASYFRLNDSPQELLSDAGFGIHGPRPPEELVETVEGWYEDAAGGEARAVCFDLDLAGYDSTDWGPGNDPIRKAARTLNTIEDPTRTITPDYVKEEMMNHVADLARRVDADEVAAAVPDDGLAETIRNNIETWREKR